MFFPVLSANFLCVFPLSSSVLPSQYVHTVILFGFFPLCSLFGCCPSFLLFSGSPFSTVLLGWCDQPVQFRVRGLLLAWRCMCGVLWSHSLSTRRALSCAGGERRVKELNFRISSTQSDEKREENHFDFTLVSWDLITCRFQTRVVVGFFLHLQSCTKTLRPFKQTQLVCSKGSWGFIYYSVVAIRAERQPVLLAAGVSLSFAPQSFVCIFGENGRRKCPWHC